MPVWIESTHGRSISLISRLPPSISRPILQLPAVQNLDGVHQRGEWVVEHGGQHAAHLGGAVVGLHAGQDQIVVALAERTPSRSWRCPAIGPFESLVRKQHAMVRAHGHLAAQDLFVVFAATVDDGDVAAELVAPNCRASSTA